MKKHLSYEIDEPDFIQKSKDEFIVTAENISLLKEYVNNLNITKEKLKGNDWMALTFEINRVKKFLEKIKI